MQSYNTFQLIQSNLFCKTQVHKILRGLCVGEIMASILSKCFFDAI